MTHYYFFLSGDEQTPEKIGDMAFRNDSEAIAFAKLLIADLKQPPSYAGRTVSIIAGERLVKNFAI